MVPLALASPAYGSVSGGRHPPGDGAFARVSEPDIRRSGVQFPKQWLSRPISIAAASCLRVTDGFDKTAETASHFVGALRRSPAHPVNIKANSRTMILIRPIYPY